MSPPRYVLIDRDGTINEDPGYLADPARVVLLPGAAAGLRALGELGLGLVVVSNQSGIGRGYYSEAAMHQVNARLAELLQAEGVQIARFYYCPHAPDVDCPCRKPRPGMAERAARELGFELVRSFVIGDKASDIGLARAIGAIGILVRTGEGRQDEARAQAPFVADDLPGAAAIVGTLLAAAH